MYKIFVGFQPTFLRSGNAQTSLALLALLKRNVQLLSIMFTLTVPVAAQNAAMPDTTLIPKNVLIEEFTGIHCSYCPGGHRIIQNISNAIGSRFSAYCNHTGSLAVPNEGEPDFRTQAGSAFFAAQGGQGMPSGNFHRQVFQTSISSSAYNVPLANWTKTVKKYILNDTASVNLTIAATLDTVTRVLTINIKGYFTKPTDTKLLLNVALTENFQIGAQTGSADNPNYVHKHVLRDMLTGSIWGDTLLRSATNKFDTTYTYTVPQNYNNRSCNINNLEIICFLTQLNHKNVLNSVNAKPQLTPASPYEKPYVHIGLADMGDKYGGQYFTLNVFSLGTDTLKTLDVAFALNGVRDTVTLTNLNITSKTEKQIQVPLKPYEIKNTNLYSIVVVKANGQEFRSNALNNGSFVKPEVYAFPTNDTAALQTAKLIIYFTPDTALGMENENSIMVRSVKGDVLFTKTYQISDEINIDTVTINKNEYVQFRLYDTWGDGMESGGFELKLQTPDSTMLLGTTKDNISFAWNSVLLETAAIESKTAKQQNIKAFGIDGILHIQNPDKIFLESAYIYDITGRQIKEMTINSDGDISLFTGILNKLTMVVLKTKVSVYPTVIKVKF
jgi:hypothetical protein